MYLIAWSKHYSNQAEIHAYLQNVAKKHHLYERTRFQTEVVRIEWIESKHQWFIQWRSVKDHNKTGSGYYNTV